VAAVVREIERKYDITGAKTAQFDGVPGAASMSPPTEEVLDAVYYDTEDLRLIRGGVTLRQRSGGPDAGWHLKLPSGPDARDEVRLPATGTGGPVPEELASLVRARTRGAPLAPIIRIRTVRDRRRLLDPAGRALAEIAADKVRAEPIGGVGAVSWEELEVELVGGDMNLLTALDERLRAAGARPAAAASKLARALGDRLDGAAGDTAEPVTATPDSPAADVVLGYLRTKVGAITHFDPLVRRSEPDAVHQMRVAIRRVRSALQVFREIVDRERTRALGDELKWLAAVLGRERDAEVLAARLRKLLAALPAELVAGPVEERVTRHFSSELAQAHAAAVRELDGPRYFALLDALDALLDDPPLHPDASRPAAQALRRPVRRAAKRLKRALKNIPGRDPSPDKDTAIHEARKAAKRARYAADAAAPALGGKAARQAARAKALQTLLGNHHDSVVARTFLRTLAGQAHAAGEDTFTYGVMHEREASVSHDIERSLAKR